MLGLIKYTIFHRKYLLIGYGDGAPPLWFGDHVGLVTSRNHNGGGSEPARLAVQLHGDSLEGFQFDFTALYQPLPMTPHVQGCLKSQNFE